MLVVLAVITTSAGASDRETILRADFRGAYELRITQFLRETFVWEVITSTEGWCETNTGLMRRWGAWDVIAMVGIDFAQDETDRVVFESLRPELFALHTGSTHSETWIVPPITFGDIEAPSPIARQLFSYRPGWLPVFFGGQYDAFGGQGVRPEHFAGPLIEFEPTNTTLASFTLQWQINDKERGPSQFLLTVQTFF